MSEQTIYNIVSESVPRSALDHLAWCELLHCFSSIERSLMECFALDHNSTIPRYDVLTTLALMPDGLTMSELASMLQVTKGNSTGVVRRLKKDGFVRKVTSTKDRRVQLVTISEKGKRLWVRMRTDYERIVSEILSNLTEGELIQLREALAKTTQAASSGTCKSTKLETDLRTSLSFTPNRVD